jgi:hypothetical protein
MPWSELNLLRRSGHLNVLILEFADRPNDPAGRNGFRKSGLDRLPYNHMVKI